MSLPPKSPYVIRGYLDGNEPFHLCGYLDWHSVCGKDMPWNDYPDEIKVSNEELLKFVYLTMLEEAYLTCASCRERIDDEA